MMTVAERPLEHFLLCGKIGCMITKRQWRRIRGKIIGKGYILHRELRDTGFFPHDHALYCHLMGYSWKNKRIGLNKFGAPKNHR